MGAYSTSAVPGAWYDRLDLACRQADVNPDVFFPEIGGPTGDAKAICNRCPALLPCRLYALSQPPHYLYGVWGATSQRDRLATAVSQREARSAA